MSSNADNGDARDNGDSSDGEGTRFTRDSAKRNRSDHQSESDSVPARVRLYRFVPSWIRRQYRAKFLISLLTVALVIVLAGAISYVQINDAIEQDGSDKLETITSHNARSLGNWVETMRSQTAIVARSSTVPAKDAARNRYVCNTVARASADVIAIHYVDTDMQRVSASSHRQYRGQPLSAIDKPWRDPIDQVVQSKASRVVVSDRAYKQGDTQALAFVSRVQDSRDVLVLVASVDSLHEMLTAAHASMSTRIVSSDGTSVFTSSDPAVGTDSPDFTSAVNGETPDTTANGVVRASTSVPGTDWVAITEASESDLYQSSQVVSRMLVLVVGSGLVSVLVVGVVLARWTVTPLVRLRHVIEDVEDGNLDVDISTHRRDEIGQLYAAFRQMRDALTEQVREAQQVRYEAERSKRELERQNSRLDQFASTLSHDLRNPLAVARGHVELLATKLPRENGNQELLDHLETIDDAHDRIDSIINDVLTLTRKGESVQEAERFDLEAAAREAWSNIDNRNATLEVEQSRSVDGDRSRLMRAFENLFRNSIDHAGEDVTVTLGLTRDGFYVEDDGSGIPDDEIENIFEYGHTTSTDGTGLGLSIVKTIVEAHGWSIWVDGTYERGARFVFSNVFESEREPFAETEFTWAKTLRQD